ncbi:MAG TPA: hypothetical protein VJT81_14165 [Burkholderiales bacterium]|nr:hypothetical protein [Burkholderiales bacterium]
MMDKKTTRPERLENKKINARPATTRVVAAATLRFRGRRNPRLGTVA